MQRAVRCEIVQSAAQSVNKLSVNKRLLFRSKPTPRAILSSDYFGVGAETSGLRA